MDVAHKNILITGANRGIGLALARELLQRGAAKIYAAARRPAELPDFGDSRVVPLPLDITDPGQVRRAVERAPDVDLLINNAGVAAFATLLDGDAELIERDMNTNYYGTLDMIRRFVPALEKREQAAIVNVVTIGAFVNFPMLGGYSASKAALFSASQGIRIELVPRGIAVHTVNPGPIDTDMTRPMEMDKTSPEDTARGIVDGLVRGEADIFPDPGAQQMFELWKQGYRKLEQMVHDMHHAA